MADLQMPEADSTEQQVEANARVHLGGMQAVSGKGSRKAAPSTANPLPLGKAKAKYKTGKPGWWHPLSSGSVPRLQM
ncbi:hypothetical protein P7K49_021113, partial [Saguinus oedipus]